MPIIFLFILDGSDTTRLLIGQKEILRNTSPNKITALVTKRRRVKSGRSSGSEKTRR